MLHLAGVKKISKGGESLTFSAIGKGGIKMKKSIAREKFKELPEALDQLSDCATKVAFLMEVSSEGAPENMEGAGPGLSLILRDILSEMDEANQYLRNHLPTSKH